MIKQEIDKILFIDIETAGCEYDLDSLEKANPKLSEAFKSYKPYLLNRFPDVSEESIENIFKSKSALLPEFGRVICFSFGLIKDGDLLINSFYGTNEKEILTKAKKVFERAIALDMHLAGHNIEKFDLPYIATRMIINGIEPPSNIPDESTKPWETKIIDTKKIWQRNNYHGLSSLELVCTVLGFDSPKEGDVKGETVHDDFYVRNKYEEIKTYCETDVRALFYIILNLKSLK